MAANKFATMLERKSHKMTVMLVYAVLEWTLIFLLLLNSFFTYLISKFASYFGLKPPCFWCSRLDRLLDPNKDKESFTHLLCETHASEISRLSYCSNHHRLAEAESMCQACLPDHSTQRIAFLSWVSQDSPERDDARKVCSCCNDTLNSCPPCFLLKPFPWDALRYLKKGSLIMDGELDKNGCEIERIGLEDEPHILSDFESFSFREGGEDCSRSSQSDDNKELQNQHEKVSAVKFTHQSNSSLMMQCCFREDTSFQLSQNYITYDDSHRLFPVELIDSSTTATQSSCSSEKEHLTQHDQTCNEENLVNVVEPSDPPAKEDEEQLDLGGDQAKSGHLEGDNLDSQQGDIEENVFVETSLKEETTTLAYKSQEEIDHHLSLVSDSNTAEEEKFPETPTSIQGLKKLVMFDRREMGAEESLDGSVASEIECGDSSLSIEQMKTALKAERKALSAIYAELEEERSASAIAANQTMAMITRLQEEKAAMQMEALQYQRMMEEQSEYDQEALQLLNELMTKRDREKQELENELEIYRNKVLEYEARDKVMMARARNGSTTSREVSDEPELSIDLNREAREEEDSFYKEQEDEDFNTQMVLDCVKNIGAYDVSLTEFEEEKQAILEQLKTLEEKLLTVGDDQFFEDLKSIENLASIKEFDDIEPSGRKSLGSMVKSLLPLLDAAENEELEGSMSKEQVKSEALEMLNSLDSKFEMDHGKKVENEEEVDRVYERIQDLEVDKDFLQQCMNSIEKRDKGVDTLQEILQHLRDLRTMDLHLRTMNDDQQGEVALEYQE